MRHRRPAVRARLSWTSLVVSVLTGAFVLANGPQPVRAAPVSHPSSLGLGLMLGSPTGLTLKQSFGGSNAWDLGIGIGPGLRVHADYLWGLAQLLPDTSTLSLDLYLGLGPVMGIGRGWCGSPAAPNRRCGGDFYIGVRVPVGLEARLTRAPVSFGIEVAPGIELPPHTNGLLDAFLFVRFNFY